MGMVVLLLDGKVRDLSLGPEAIGRLATLGVTYAALLQDEEGVALVLEGRTFDGSRSVPVALRAVGGGPVRRKLEPMAQLSVGGS